MNRFLDEREQTPPEQKYRIRFMPADVTVEVDPGALPRSRTGLPGCILDIAVARGPEIGMRWDCGGLCSCATCAVVVTQGLETCNPRRDFEDEVIRAEIADATPNHRLACQCVPNGRGDVVVVVWHTKS